MDIRKALGFSLLLHLALLGGWLSAVPLPESAKPGGGEVLQAALVAAAPRGHAVPEALPARPTTPLPATAPAVLPKQDSPSQVSSVKTPVLAVDAREAARSVAVASPVPVAPAAVSSPVIPASEGGREAARNAGDGGRVPAPETQVPADVLRQYRLSLAREARRYRQFPRLARLHGWEGQVVLVVGTVLGQAVPQVSLSQSSGREVLDQAALEMMSLAVRNTPLPEALQHREFALTLPVQFSLED